VRLSHALVIVVVGGAAFLLGRHTARQTPQSDPSLFSGADRAQSPVGSQPILHGVSIVRPVSEGEPPRDVELDAVVSAVEVDEEPADEEPVAEDYRSLAELQQDSRLALEAALESLDRCAWDRFDEVLPLVDPQHFSMLDARFIALSRLNRITPWNVEHFVFQRYLWKTGRTSWAHVERFVQDGMAGGGRLQVAAFVVLALRATPPPEPHWFEWVLERYELPEKVVEHVRDHLRDARRNK
jgi:hypothetical protein